MTEDSEVPFTRQVGRMVGENVGKPLLERRLEKVNQFDIDIRGAENLEVLDDNAYIIAANHEIPSGKLDQQSGFSPDAFAISRAVYQSIGRDVKIVSKSDGWFSIGLYRPKQRTSHNFSRGFIEGMGLIPVRKDSGSYNRDFVQIVDELVQQHEGVLIFPQGNWYEDYNPAEHVHSGMSFFARRHNIPIIPTYIRGALTWDSGQKVNVLFGNKISPEGKGKQELNEEWTASMSHLQQQYK